MILVAGTAGAVAFQQPAAVQLVQLMFWHSPDKILSTLYVATSQAWEGRKSAPGVPWV